MIGNQFKETLIDDVRFVINRLSENEKAIDALRQALLDCVTSIESDCQFSDPDKAKIGCGWAFEQEAKHGREVLAKLESFRKGMK